MPGTDLQVDFALTLRRLHGQWSINLSFPALGTKVDCPLADWLDGLPASMRVRALKVSTGASSLKLAAGPLSVSSSDGLTLAFHSSSRLGGQVDCGARGALFSLEKRTLGHLERQLDNGPVWTTRLRLVEPSLRTRAYACGDGADLVAIRPSAPSTVEAVLFNSTQGLRQAVEIEGPAALELRTSVRGGAPLHFERAFFVVAGDRMGLAGDLVDADHSVELAGCSATVRGSSTAPFCADFRAGEPPRFSNTVRGTRLWIPVADGDGAVVDLQDSDAVLIAGDVDTIDELGLSLKDRLVIHGPSSSLIARLEDKAINVRRSEDLLNLTFRFEGFKFQFDRMSATVERRAKGGYCEEGFITVELPAQHIAEQVVPLEQCTVMGGEVPTRVAEPSRIVFHLPRERQAYATWKKKSLTIKDLTDWTGLTMRVHPRAVSTIADDDLASQMAAAGIPDMAVTPPLDRMMEQIAASLAPPDLRTTSLELAYKLILSPHEKAIWHVPAPPRPGKPMPIFGIRLLSADKPNVRAIYSRMFTQPRLFPDAAELDPGAPEELGHPSFTPLSRNDHWEIVGQTSLYGLPALRRKIDPKDAPDPNSNAFDQNLAKVPRGQVIRPTLKGGGTIPYLVEVDEKIAYPRRPAPEESGIALATAFQDVDITLTGLGATMRLDWHGDPAILRPEPENGTSRKYPRGFSNERLYYQSWLGRDVRIISITKGYLLPLGMRASLVKVGERYLYPDGTGLPVAREIVRLFLVVPRKPKYYPALDQPDGGRDFPASSVEILSGTTPDLHLPYDVAGGRIVFEGYEDCHAFWPKVVAPSGAVVDFEWRGSVDGDPTPFSNRMIWIASASAAREGFVSRVVDHYNGTLRTADPGRKDNWPVQNVTRLDGVRRSYAPPQGEIDTAFDTSSWLLVARGRKASDGTEHHVMDARMNGADQPPFYPSVKRAGIAVQSIDRLVGAPQGVIETRFYADYVAKGFVGDGQVFLEVMHPEISLNVAGKGQVTGGLAQPDTKVAALSRKIGVVGGKKGVRMAAPQGDVASLLNFSEASKGNFRPGDFFDLKILGVDLLKYVRGTDGDLTRAPKLFERIDYGAAGDGALTQITEAAKLLAERIGKDDKEPGKLRQQVEAAIAAFDKTLPANLSFDILYPGLHALFRSSMATIYDTLVALSRETELANVPGHVRTLTTTAEPLLREIGRITRNPIPPQADALFAELVAKWSRFLDEIKDVPAEIGAALLQFVIDDLGLLDGLDADDRLLLFGLNPGERIVDLLQSADARERLARTVFADQLGAPLAALLTQVRGLAGAARGRVALARLEVRAAARRAIERAVAVLAGRLVADDSDPSPNILRDSDAEALATALTEAADQCLDQLLGPAADLETMLARLGELGAKFDTQDVIALDQVIAAHQSLLHAVSATDVPAILRNFRDIVVLDTHRIALNAVRRETANVIALVQAQIDKQLDVLVKAAVGALADMLSNALAMERVARIAALGWQLADWCDAKVGGILSTAKALGDEVLAGTTAITSGLGDIAQAAAIQVPVNTPAELAAIFVPIRTSLLDASKKALAAASELDAARQTLRGVTETQTCTNSAAFVQSLSDCITRREKLSDSLKQLAGALAALEALVADPETAKTDLAKLIVPKLAQMVGLLRHLVSDATLVGKAGLAGDWDAVASGVARLEAEISDKPFQAELRQSYRDLVDYAGQLRADLATANGAALAQIFFKIDDLAAFERRLAGYVMQTVALPPDAQQLIKTAALALLRNAAGKLADLHDSALSPLGEIAKIAAKNPLIDYLLDSAIDLDTAIAAIGKDRDLLRLIETESDFAKAVGMADVLRSRWVPGPPALTSVVDALGRFVDQMLRGKLGDLLAKSARALLKEVEERLRALASELLPTAITTSFDWDAQLDNSTSDYFSMVASTQKDLTLKTTIFFNILTKERRVDVRGVLQPFVIAIPQLVDITFEEMTFTSTNGSSPDFDVRIKAVTINDQLKFLKTLQEWMSPSAGGLYVRPSASGIRVGYLFDAGLIMVGTLQFINVAFDVYAELPYTGDAAIFGFEFANAQRPFLISSPPYGGGGWVRITSGASSDQEIEIALSFMFGAVTEIAFGPLKGHGRIVAGFTSENKILKAFVEAVGEGNIACFSIGIFIRIELAHYPSGRMIGTATYEFSFKMGFVELSYGVTAHYAVQGGDGQAAIAGEAASTDAPARGVALGRTLGLAADALTALAAPAPPPLTATRRVLVEAKTVDWGHYRKHVSTELLDD